MPATRSKSRRSAAQASLIDAPIANRTLAEEVETAFLDYSMSVIVSRALPDVRDGLKPVHRRILWSMHDGGLRPDRAFVKCARVVGDVMGRYHPHGDAAIYDALVRMGQDFSLTAPLVDKHGNFGSPSDAPAASRYTECRLSPIAMELLAGLDEGTVDFVPNYDTSAQEPSVLPARFPNLLVNGAQGIAVGMATNIPPHSLQEVIDATLLLIEKPDATLSDLMRKVKGPDFPTGGQIMGRDGIVDAYKTGRGSIRLRAVTELEETKRGVAIVVTQTPYQVSVDAIAGKLAEVVEAGTVRGIRDIRNESGQGQTRLVIELKPEADPHIVLNNLFKHTPAQTTFGINMVALVDGVPRTLGLAEVLRAWIDHQVEVVTRRSRFRLEKAEARLHIVEGLLKAIDKIDAIIKAIRASADRAEARGKLMAKPFGFSEIQANHILDLPLGRLTRLGREELDAERKELEATIKALNRILKDRKVLMGVIREELTAVKDANAVKRRTQIVADDIGTIDTEALVADEPLVVTVTARGYIKGVNANSKAAKVANAGAKDTVAQVLDTTTLGSLLVFTTHGKAYRLSGIDIPMERLTAIPNLFQFASGEKVITAMDPKLAEQHTHVVLASDQGTVKRTPFSDFVDISTNRTGVTAMKLGDGERVIAAFPGWADGDVLMVTAKGQGIRFIEDEVREVGRSAAGVRGMKVARDDKVVGACACSEGEEVVIATDDGSAKRVSASEFPEQGRGGMGVRATKLGRGRNAVVALAGQADHYALLTADGGATVGKFAIKPQSRDGAGTAVTDGPAGTLERLVAATIRDA
ncbi:MAG: DNA gyrase/topoisomerase IV subunit A [Acidimicrobiia bacterium]